MEQISFFSATGTTKMPTPEELHAAAGVDIATAIDIVTDELAAYFRRHVRQREVLETVRGHGALIEVKRRFQARYQTDPAFREECTKAQSGQRYATGFVRTWLADVIKITLPTVHPLLPIDFRVTGLPIAHGRFAPAGSDVPEITRTRGVA